jgi:hypothetical protein
VPVACWSADLRSLERLNQEVRGVNYFCRSADLIVAAQEAMQLAVHRSHGADVLMTGQVFAQAGAIDESTAGANPGRVHSSALDPLGSSSRRQGIKPRKQAQAAAREMPTLQERRRSG